MKKIKIFLSLFLCLFFISFNITTNYSAGSEDTVSDYAHFSNSLISIAYGNGKFVAIGENGVIKTSSDGFNWKAQECKGISNLTAIAFNGTAFVAISVWDIYYSTDGVRWKQVHSSEGDRETFNTITVHNKIFVVGGDGELLGSSDGIYWSGPSDIIQGSVSNAGCDLFSSVIWGKKSFVALNYENLLFYVSDDGLGWDKYKIPEFMQPAISSSMISYYLNGTGFCLNGSRLSYVNGNYILTDTYNKDEKCIYYSSDLKNWKMKSVNQTYTLKTINKITYGFQTYSPDDYKTSTPENNKIIKTNDGINYSAISDIPKNQKIYDISYNGKIYVAVGTNNLILVSKDGKTFKDAQAIDVTSNNQSTNFDNKDLEQAIRNCINKPKGIITETDLRNITTITLGQESGVSNLKGISRLKNLKKIILQSPKNTLDLKELANLKNLKKISINCGYIKDISPLKNIEELSIEFGGIENLNSIKNLTRLKKIFIRYYNNGNKPNCRASKVISALKGMKTLEQLVVIDDVVDNLNDVKTLKSLKVLDLVIGNKIDKKYILPLGYLKNLQTLRIYAPKLNNGITDISVLKNLKQLQYLSIDNQNISNIDSLIRLTKLQYLSLNNNKIKNIKVLSKLRNLKWVDLKLNKLHDVNPLSNLIKNGSKVVFRDADQADFSWWSVVSPKEM